MDGDRISMLSAKQGKLNAKAINNTGRKVRLIMTGSSENVWFIHVSFRMRPLSHMGHFLPKWANMQQKCLWIWG